MMNSWVTIGAFVAAAVLLLILVALIASILRARRQGETPSRAVRTGAAWAGFLAVALLSAGAIGIVADDNGDPAPAALKQSGAENTGVETNELVTALEDQGIDVGEGVDPASVEGALAQGANGVSGGKHDHGQQPTFTQLSTMSDEELLPLFPADTVTIDDIPALRQQIMAARDVARNLDTPEKAGAAGYARTTSDVPFMGQHYLNFDLVRDGIFDPSKPEGLLFSKVDDGAEKLVGVWYLQIPGTGAVQRDVEPVGFASNLDLWHAHLGLCLVGFSGASEGETAASCAAKGGRFTADLRWMMHLWVTPETTENPAGIMAYLNNDLYEKQLAAKESSDGGAPAGVTQ